MRTGGCQCGNLRYQCADDPVDLYVCHCTECRAQSASAFGISFTVLRKDFRVTRGMPRFWSRGADSGRKVECAFCPDCGSRVWHQGSAEAESITIKGGSLDEPVDISNAPHIWTSRRLPGVPIPVHVRQYQQEPE